MPAATAVESFTWAVPSRSSNKCFSERPIGRTKVKYAHMPIKGYALIYVDRRPNTSGVDTKENTDFYHAQGFSRSSGERRYVKRVGTIRCAGVRVTQMLLDLFMSELNCSGDLMPTTQLKAKTVRFRELEHA